VLLWEIFGDDLMWLEVYAGVALLIGVAAWAFVPKVPIGLIAFAITSSLIAVGAFRPFDYNSDTSNYFSYVYYLKFVTGDEIFFLTKLEPVHAALIFITRDFRLWVIAEAAIEIFGLYLSYRVRPNAHSFILLCAFVLTLSTSSLRFCASLIYFFYFISKEEVTIVRAVRVTAILSLFHISMLLSGAMALQKRIAPLAVAVLCLAIFFESSVFLGARLDVVDYLNASTGRKTFAVAVSAVLYLILRQPLGKSAYLGLYLLSLLSLFLISSTVLVTFNRFLIVGALVILIKEWRQVRGDNDDIFDRGMVLLLATAVVAPYVLTLPQLYFSGEW